MGKADCRKLLFTGALLVMLLGPAAFGVPTNGCFNSGLDSWMVEYGTVSDGGGYALFAEDATSLTSTLSQSFLLPTGAQELSFEIVMASQAGGAVDMFAPPDAFAAYLLDPVTYAPLLSNPGYTDYFYLDSTGTVETVATISGPKVSLDVSSFAGQEVFLSFDLFGGADGMETTVCLDNVGVSVVPAPGAVLLAGVGVGLVNWLRRAKIL